MTLRSMRIASSVLAVAVTAIVLAAGAASASAWAPAESATIHPGVMTFTGAPSFLGGAGEGPADFLYTHPPRGGELRQGAHRSPPRRHPGKKGRRPPSPARGAP